MRLSLFLLSQLALTYAWTTYTVPHSSTPGADDTPALAAALASRKYSTNSTILFQKGVTYNVFTPITFSNLSNVEVRVEGNLTLPTDVKAIQAIVRSSSVTWFTFSGGNNVTLRGSLDPQWGWIDGHGQQWWDAKNQVSRPHGVAFKKINNGVIRDLKIWKPIAQVFSTSGSKDLHVFNNTILAIPTNQKSGFPFNTDGFSAAGTNLLFEDNWVANGDDCLTVGSGAINVTFRNSHCKYGHGLSIGSLGSGGSVADVQNVWIENVVVEDSLYAARFKSWTGGSGLARNITWKKITFSKVRFPIYVTQNYWNQELGPQPSSGAVKNTHIEDLAFESFTGTIDDNPTYHEGTCISHPCWYDVANATSREVIIFDLYPGTAKNIVAKGISAKALHKTGVLDVMCNSTAVSNDVGFKCWNGPFVASAAGRV